MRKGFTLLEMLIVVVIISILASTAFMYYERFMERMRIAEADTIIGAAILSQERVYVRFQHYTTYWHKLDAVPVAVRKPKEQNDFANGEENTIYYTRGGMLSGEPRNGFAISFEKNEAGRWFAVAQRVGSSPYTYRIVRPFDSTQFVCVPDWDNEKDIAMCVDYMGVEDPSELLSDPMDIQADEQADGE